jgi:hypothetical protein
VKVTIAAAALLALAAGRTGTASPSEDKPAYTVVRTRAAKAALLGDNEHLWRPAMRVTWGEAPYATAFRALWAEGGLAVRFDADDPQPWSTLTERDASLWKEEVVEVFIALDDSGTEYAEVEINPKGVVCDVLMHHGYPNWDGDLKWNFAGLDSAVYTRRDKDKTIGWTAVAWLPWEGFRSLAPAKTVAVPPKPGDHWKLNVFRIKRPNGPKEPERDAVLAAWSPTGAPSFHVPAAFRDLVFAPK